MPPIVALAAGKGGVGTSTAAALLGAIMASSGREVLLIDASDHLGTLDAILGVTARVPLEALRGGRAEPSDLLLDVGAGLTLLPAMGAHGDASLPAPERRVLFARIAEVYPRFDLVLVDAGATADSMLGACASGVTRVLAVTTADRITVTATYALIKQLHDRHPGMRVDLLASRLSQAAATQAHDAINAATVRFLSKTVHLAGVVPEDPHFGAAIAAGLGTRDAAEGSFAAPVMQDIGDRLFDPPAAAPALTSRSLRRN
jgi:MinD-like ATPase involved in chromosome partitioning or flagellar assembly